MVGQSADSAMAASVHYEGVHKCLYANIRGLRQGAGELAAMVRTADPHFVFLTECHIAKGEPINMWVPSGYKVVAKRWRSKHGGGLLILSKEHLLCDPLDLKAYHIEEAAELIGMRFGGVTYIDAYSNQSELCKQMVAVLKRLRADLPVDKLVILGDFNIHNEGWLHSVSGTDAAGELMEEFVQLNGFNQFVDFPTRDANTLDLIISDLDGSAVAAAHLGTSDHVSIKFEIQVEAAVPEDESRVLTRSWRKAPWAHIRGEIKRVTRGWAPKAVHSVSEAEAELDAILWGVVERHVKFRAPTQPRVCPWWNRDCQLVYKQKLQAFTTRRERPAHYCNIKKRCKKVQRKEFAEYNSKLSSQLKGMEKSDKKFWELTKRISGLEQSRNKAAPDA